jgi:hypothetical protein
MYLARFSYSVLPANRQRAIDYIRREIAAAQSQGLSARLLVPLTRGPGGAALQFDVELTSLDQIESLRHEGAGSPKTTHDWMHEFSQVLVSPPEVEIIRVDKPKVS